MLGMRPGGHFPKIWVEMCGALLETLALFQTNIYDFPQDFPYPTIF